MASGALYRSSVTGRVLHSTVNTSMASPTLSKTGKPPSAAEWDDLLHPSKPQLGRFTIAGSVPPAMEPLATTRQMTVTNALVDKRRTQTQSVSSPSKQILDYSSDATEAASAGSFHPKGPALSDPDGISMAVTTLRKFRGLIETMGGKPIAKEPEPVAKTDVGAVGTQRADSHARGHRALMDDEGGPPSTAMTTMTSAPLVPTAPPSVAAAVAASASGTAVVGTLSVGREHLMRATMVCSKWTRIVTTQYGASTYHPCRFVLEMQQQYYTSFLNDLHDATNGEFVFETEPAPTAIKANIGAINMLIKQGATDFGPHLLPSHASNKKRRFRIVEAPKAVNEETIKSLRSMGLTTFNPEEPGILGDTSKGKFIELYSDNGEHEDFEKTVAETAEMHEARFTAPDTLKGTTSISRAEAQYTEFIKVKRQTLVRAGRTLRRAAQAGDTKTMARLIIRGEPVYIDPRPWYERNQLVRESDEGETPEQNDSLVKTDQVAKPPIDWAERDGETALMYAVRCNQVNSVQTLLEMGANPKKKNAAGMTAIDLGFARIVEATEDMRNRVSGSVAARKQAAEVMKLLDSRTFLEVVKAGDIQRARYLLDFENCDVNQGNAYGITPLHLAVLEGNAEMASLLIKNGANHTARNNIGQTPESLIDDLPKKRDRDAMRTAFTSGAMEDEARRKLIQAKTEKFNREREELLQFEKKLRTLTRGTAAAKTLRSLTDTIHSAVRTPATSKKPTTIMASPLTASQRAARDILSPQATAHTEPATARMPTANPFSSTTMRPGQVPVGGGHHGRKPDVGHTSSPASPRKTGVSALYDESAKRHIRDYAAVSMKEERAANARASSRGEPAVAKASDFNDILMKQLYAAQAPPPLEQKFDVWFKAHVAPKVIRSM